jgi:hypothetical protein
MDQAFPIDPEALLESISRSEHALFRFATVSPRLFVDFRESEEVGPGVHVLPPASSLIERIGTIREVRPDLPMPERLLVVAWPLRVGGLERLGVVPLVRDRLADLEAYDQMRELDLAFEALLSWELVELNQAVTGEGYRTLWSSGEPER